MSFGQQPALRHYPESEPIKKDDEELCSSLPVAADGSSDWLEKERPLDTAFRMVELSRIEIGPIVRREVSDADIRTLSHNIRQQKEQGNSLEGCGILQPLIVRPRTTDDGTVVPGYVLMKGLRRLKAAEVARLDFVPVQVMEADDEKARLASIVMALTGREHSLHDRALAIVETMEKFGYSVREMARKTGLSKSTVDRAIQAIDLPADLKRAWELRPTAMEPLLLLRDLKNGEMRKRLIEQITDTTVDPKNNIRPLNRQRTKEIIEGIEEVERLYQLSRISDMTALFLCNNIIELRMVKEDWQNFIADFSDETEQKPTEDVDTRQQSSELRKAADESKESGNTDAVNHSQLPVREQLGLPPLADDSRFRGSGNGNAKQNRSLDCLAEDVYWATGELTQILSDLRQSLKMLQDLGSKLPQDHPASDEMKRGIRDAEKELALLKGLLD